MIEILSWLHIYISLLSVEGEGIFAPRGTPTKLIVVWKIGWVIYILIYVTSDGPLVDFR